MFNKMTGRISLPWGLYSARGTWRATVCSRCDWRDCKSRKTYCCLRFWFEKWSQTTSGFRICWNSAPCDGWRCAPSTRGRTWRNSPWPIPPRNRHHPHLHPHDCRLTNSSIWQSLHRDPSNQIEFELTNSFGLILWNILYAFGLIPRVWIGRRFVACGWALVPSCSSLRRCKDLCSIPESVAVKSIFF